MKDRMTLGFQSDAAETAALTLRDNCATMRVFAYCDWEHDNRRFQRRVDNAVRRLEKGDRPFFRAVLRGKNHEDLGISKKEFDLQIEKILKILKTPAKRGRKPSSKAQKRKSKT